MATTPRQRTEVGPTASTRLATTLVLAQAVGLFVLGYVAMFSQFSDYDDEGYVLVMLRELSRQGGLYDRVYSQYGPFFELVFAGPARALGVEWTLTLGRLVTLAVWVAIAVLAALVLLKVGRSIVLALAGEAAVFLLLEPLTYEPMHPSGLINLAIVGLVAVRALATPRAPRFRDVATGVLLAGLTLTKVNVGVGSALAIAFVLVMTTASYRRSPLWSRLVGAGVVLLGPVAILSAGAAQWKVGYALVYLAAAGLLLVCAAATPPDDQPYAKLRWLLWGAVITAAIAVGYALATGTTASGLVQGILLRPLEHVKATVLPLDMPIVAIAWLVAIPLLYRLLSRFSSETWRQANARAIAVARVALGALFVMAILGLLPFTGMALLPLTVLPIVPASFGTRSAAETSTRLLLVALGVVNSLYAYPVAGAQVSTSLLLPLVCALLAIGDGVVEWRATQPVDERTDAVRVVAITLASLLVLVLGARAWSWVSTYEENVALDEPGTALVRLPADTVTNLRWVTDTVRENCQTFVSSPGLDTFYVTTELPPPTGYNATVWRRLLTRTEQQAVVDALRSTKGNVCLVRVDTLYSYARFPSGIPTDPLPDISPGPLVDYVSDGSWRSLGSSGPYSVWMRTAP